MLYIGVIWIRGQGWGEQLKHMDPEALGLSHCVYCRQKRMGELKVSQMH